VTLTVRSTLLQSWTCGIPFGREAGQHPQKLGAKVEDVNSQTHQFIHTRGPRNDVIPIVVPPLKLSMPATPRSPMDGTKLATTLASARASIGSPVQVEASRDSSELAHVVLAEMEARGAATDRPKTSVLYSKEDWWTDSLCGEQRRGKGFSSLRVSRDLGMFERGWQSKAERREAFVQRYMSVLERRGRIADTQLSIRDVEWAPQRATLAPEKGVRLDLDRSAAADAAARRRQLEQLPRRLNGGAGRESWVPPTAEAAGGGRPALLDKGLAGTETRRAMYARLQRERNTGPRDSRRTWTAPPSPLAERSAPVATDFQF